MDQKNVEGIDLELQQEFEDEVKMVEAKDMADFEEVWKMYAEERRAGVKTTFGGFIIYNHFRSQFSSEEEWQAYLSWK